MESNESPTATNGSFLMSAVALTSLRDPFAILHSLVRLLVASLSAEETHANMGAGVMSFQFHDVWCYDMWLGMSTVF